MCYLSSDTALRPQITDKCFLLDTRARDRAELTTRALHRFLVHEVKVTAYRTQFPHFNRDLITKDSTSAPGNEFSLTHFAQRFTRDIAKLTVQRTRIRPPKQRSNSTTSFQHSERLYMSTKDPQSICEVWIKKKKRKARQCVQGMCAHVREFTSVGESGVHQVYNQGMQGQ